MEKVVYIRNKKIYKEIISITDAYKVYALNSNLPVYNETLKDDGDYFSYFNEDGNLENRKPSDTFDELVAKNIYSIFKDKVVNVNGKMVDKFIQQKDKEGLGAYLSGAFEDDMNVELRNVDDSTDLVVLKIGKYNCLNMNVGTIAYNKTNEIHVAFERAGRAMYFIAENLCE